MINEQDIIKILESFKVKDEYMSRPFYPEYKIGADDFKEVARAILDKIKFNQLCQPMYPLRSRTKDEIKLEKKHKLKNSKIINI